MCGRTACTLNPHQISSAARYKNSKGNTVKPKWRKGDTEKYRQSYNKAPQSFCPVLVHARHVESCDSEDSGKDEERVITAMKWGLLPPWVKDGNQAQYKMNNARSDTMLSKASYKQPLVKGQRCVVLADGFYEWNTTKKEKQPYFIFFREADSKNETSEVKMENDDDDTDPDECNKRLVTMAGMFERRKIPDEDDLFTFSVITVDSHPAFSWLHHRMPAMLENEQEIQKWLNFGEVSLGEAIELIKPKDCLEWYPVSKFVNNSRNNSPECLEKVDLTKVKELKQTPESKGMARWLAKSPVKGDPEVTSVKQEVMSQKVITQSPAKKRISPGKKERAKHEQSPKTSPTTKGVKRKSSASANLMVGWLKKQKQG